MLNTKPRITVIGAGSWGGTIAWLLSKKQYDVKLWTPFQNEYEHIKKTKSLIRPKKLKLNKHIKITSDLNYAVEDSKLIIIAVPTNAFKETSIKLKKLNLKKDIILLSATKGITTTGNLRPSTILKKYFPKNPIVVLSGPNIALDVVSKAPIMSVIASKNLKTALTLQKILSSSHFRIYINMDITGVEIAGALKNVIAIASGMSDGFGFNISTKAGLISRGLTEIARIIVKEGGQAKTLLGGAGIGDLIATCCSENSRNYKVGYQIAKGRKLKTILKELGQVAEGVDTVKSMIQLARKHKVEIPIANAVHEVLIKGKKSKLVLNKLLNRPLPMYEIEF